MNWILLLIVVVSGSPPVVTTVEFANERGCMIAAIELANDELRQRASEDLTEPRVFTRTYCLEREAKQRPQDSR